MPSVNFAQVGHTLRTHIYRRRILLGVLLALFIVYTLLGYLWLPGFIKAKGEAALSAQLNRKVSIEQVAVQPYALGVTLHKVRVAGRAGEADFLSLNSLYVNLSGMSLLRLAPVISELRLDTPHANVIRDKDGHLNVADMFLSTAARGGSKEAVQYSISNIQVLNGRVDFDDRLKKSHQSLSNVKLGLPFIANFESAEDAWVVPHFSGRINEGALITLDGKLRPFADKREMDLDIQLDGLDLTGIDEYAPVVAGLKLVKGKLGSDLRVTFVQGKGTPPRIKLDGKVTLNDLALENQGSLPWRFNASQFELSLNEVDPTLQYVSGAAVAASKISFQQGRHSPVQISLLNVSDIRLDPKARTVALTLAASTGSEKTPGNIKLSGQGGWAPLQGEFELGVDKFDLTPFQGYLNKKLATRLARGYASVTGKVTVSDAPLNIAFSGNSTLSQFVVQDEAGDLDLLRWRALEAQDIALTTSPLMVEIKTMSLADFYGRALISEDGKLNLKQLVKKDEAASAEPPPEASPSAPLQTPEKRESDLPLKIGQLILTNGRLDLNDRFIKPNYRANLVGLTGKAGPLEPGKQGDIEIRGSVDKSAPVYIVGKLDPFAEQTFLDIKASVKGIDLPTLSPYSSRYVGYIIEKGKLSVDVHYRMEKGLLNAENNIFVSQLTLGDKVEGPDAPSIPIKLAVTLLKDSRGEINMKVPITGTLKDPQFKMGELIWQALLNLMGKVITAPFSFLGKSYGDGADLSYLDFVPGRSRLTPESEKNLESLTQAMKERPTLALDVTGVADPVIDGEGLRNYMLERRVKAQKLAEMDQAPEGGMDAIIIPGNEYAHYLALAYAKEKFEKPRNIVGIAKDLPVEEMQRLMLAHIPVGEAELRALAERRAKNARDWLLEKGVPSERLFLLRAKTQSNEKKPTAGVEFSLR